jgi:hypothetical protein
MAQSEVFDLAAQVRAETDKAWLLFDGTQVWNNGDGTYTMPVWLAKDKGFI